MANNEIGRELNANELRPGQVVVVKTPQGVYLTVWVKSVDLIAKLVVFYAGLLRTAVVNSMDDDGKILDDQQREIHVYEYLGEV